MRVTNNSDRAIVLNIIRSHLDACLKATGGILDGDPGDGVSRNSIEYLEINDMENMLCRISDCVKSAIVNNDMDAAKWEGGRV